MKQITQITVTYADGATQTWIGNGSLREVRTPVAAQGAPVLKDSDLSFVSAVLRHDRITFGGGPDLVPDGATTAPAVEGEAQ